MGVTRAATMGTAKIIRNPDEAFFKQVSKAIADNDGYCVCEIEHVPDTKCMCKAFRDQPEGRCNCGLYIKIREKKEDNNG